MVVPSASAVRSPSPPASDEVHAGHREVARPRPMPLAPVSLARTSQNTNGGDAAEAPPTPLAPAPFSTVRMAGGHPPSPPTNDAALVSAALGGDPRAFTAIWARYSPLVRSKLGRSIGGNDLDDHVQEVFFRLYDSLPDLREPAALRSFIIGITLRIAGTELRRRRCRWWLTLTPSGEVPEPCTFDDGELRRIVTRLLGTVDKLAPDSARVFELRFVEEKELSEVAETMQVSLATAKRHLARIWSRFQAMAVREPLLAPYVQAQRATRRLGAQLELPVVP